jgi:hypothetical protein
MEGLYTCMKNETDQTLGAVIDRFQLANCFRKMFLSFRPKQCVQENGKSVFINNCFLLHSFFAALPSHILANPFNRDAFHALLEVPCDSFIHSYSPTRPLCW